MVKEVCNVCCSSDERSLGSIVIPWNRNDDRNWEIGIIICGGGHGIYEFSSSALEKTEPPEWCKMKLEHVVMGQYKAHDE